MTIEEQPTPTAEQAPELTTVKQMLLPLKILISPVKTFGQLVHKSALKGLLSLSALILVATAATLYTFATKVFVNINDQPTSFLAADSFSNWYISYLVSTTFGIVVYWLIFATGLVLISRMLGGKDISFRILFPDLAYLLSVFVILYAVRTVVYWTLPSLYFSELSHWPPINDAEISSAVSVIEKNWGSLPSEIDFIFSFASFAWLAILGTAAVKVLRELQWKRAILVSVIAITFTFFLLRLP